MAVEILFLVLVGHTNAFQYQHAPLNHYECAHETSSLQEH